jgi:hypothetical protein
MDWADVLKTLITAVTSVIVALVTAGYFRKTQDKNKEKKSREEKALIIINLFSWVVKLTPKFYISFSFIGETSMCTIPMVTFSVFNYICVTFIDGFFTFVAGCSGFTVE